MPLIRVFQITSDDEPLTEAIISNLPTTEYIPTGYEFFTENSYWKLAYDLGYRTAMGISDGQSTEIVYLIKKAQLHLHLKRGFKFTLTP